jgi:glutaminyl-peptide cyclotransferase
MSTYHTKLSEISLFLLLDLLGSPSPTIPSYFKTTHWAYKHMAELELRMRKLEIFRSGGKPWLRDIHKKDGWHTSGIEDDHIPFMARGVEVLHMIPIPFPNVWHTIDDDADHLDMATVEDWAKLTTAFAAEWLDLEGFLQGDQKKERDVDEGYGSQEDANNDKRHVRAAVERDEL